MDQEIVISSASVTDRGLSDKRPENEDSYLEMPRKGIYAVADGVGGAQAGEVASQMAMEILGEAFANIPVSADAETVMRTAIERANTAIFQMAHELPQLASMATTIVALHLNGNIATIGHVGDSRLYRVDREGELYRDTADHSMVAEEVRAGRMTEEQAENHPSRNIISRALGAEATVEPDLKTIMVEPGTAFLLCSDGITRHVGDQEIRGVLTFGGTPQDVCDYLKDLCFQRGAEDNLTAVVIKLAGTRASAPPPATVPAAPLPDRDTVEIEEMTVATVRTAEAQREDETAPLDIGFDTGEMDTRDVAIDIDELFPTTQPIVSNDTIQLVSGEREVEPEPATKPAPDPPPEPPAETPGEAVLPLPAVEKDEPEVTLTEERPHAMPHDDEIEQPRRSSAASFLTSLLMLVIGGAIGIGVYYYVFVKPQLERQANAIPPITEMESRNQQLSAFEENRRNVDTRPADALAQFGASPSDAEDFYLVGRAHMLLGQYNEAKKAFMDSKARIAAGDVDANNRKTLETDIAMAMTVLNDSTVQTILKSQLNPAAGLPSNSNQNTAR